MQLGFLPWFTLQHFPSLLSYSNLTLHPSVLHEVGFLLFPHTDCASASLCHAVWSVESQCALKAMWSIDRHTVCHISLFSSLQLHWPSSTPCLYTLQEGVTVLASMDVCVSMWHAVHFTLALQCRADPVGGKVLQSTLVSGSIVAPWLTNTSATFTLSSWAARWRGVSPLWNTQVQQM